MRDLHLTHLRAVLIIDDEDVQSVLAMLHHLSGDNKASHLQPRRRERLLERIAHSRAVVGGAAHSTPLRASPFSRPASPRPSAQPPVCWAFQPPAVSPRASDRLAAVPVPVVLW